MYGETFWPMMCVLKVKVLIKLLDL